METTKKIFEHEELKILLPMAGNCLRKTGDQVHVEIRGEAVVITRLPGNRLIGISTD